MSVEMAAGVSDQYNDRQHTDRQHTDKGPARHAGEAHRPKETGPKEMEQAETVAVTPTKRANAAPSRTVEGSPIEVVVDERGVERAIRKLKRKCDTEGVTREIKRRRHYEKPSDRKRRKRRDAERRRRRAARRVARSTRDRR